MAQRIFDLTLPREVLAVDDLYPCHWMACLPALVSFVEFLLLVPAGPDLAFVVVSGYHPVELAGMLERAAQRTENYSRSMVEVLVGQGCLAEMEDQDQQENFARAAGVTGQLQKAPMVCHEEVGPYMEKIALAARLAAQ